MANKRSFWVKNPDGEPRTGCEAIIAFIEKNGKFIPWVHGDLYPPFTTCRNNKCQRHIKKYLKVPSLWEWNGRGLWNDTKGFISVWVHTREVELLFGYWMQRIIPKQEDNIPWYVGSW